MLFFTWWKLCRITSPQPWLCIFKRVLLSLYVYIYIYFFFSDLHFAQTYQKLHKETRKLQQTHHSFLPMVACYWLSCIRTVRKLTLTKRNQLDDRPYWDFMFLQVLIFSFFFLFFLFFFCVFLGLYLLHMETPRLGVELELQLLACTTAMATPDPSWIFDLYHSSQQHRNLNPRSEA